MIKRKIFGFFIIFLMLMISISVVTAQNNQTHLMDDSSEIQSNDKTFDDIQTQIDEASENDTIELDGTYLSRGSEIEINKSLTIQSKSSNVVLDGKNSSGIFKITGDDPKVVLKNLNFINTYTRNIEDEYSTVYTGAINTRSSLDLVNCNFKDNDGMLIVSAVLTCTNTTFINNKLTFDSIINSDIIKAFSNCNFINNTAYSSLAATIFGPTNITNSNFTENTLLNAKDSFLTFSEYGSTIIKNSNFINNKGGVVRFNDYEKSQIINSSFINNRFGAHINGNSDIINCKFINNTQGGLILSKYFDLDYEPYWLIDTANSTVENTTFEFNNGCALYSSNNLKLKNCIFENNSDDYAGALVINGATATVSNCSFNNSLNVAIILKSDINLYTLLIGDTVKKYNAKLIINNKTYSKSAILDDNLKQMKLVNVKINNLTTYYKSNAKLTITLTNKITKKAVSDSVVEFKVFTGKKSKTYYVRTNSKGVASLAISGLNAGSHKVEVTSDYGVCKIDKKTVTAKITKAKTTIKSPKVTFKFKKTRYFKITVKSYKKAVKNVKIKVKVKTGKKYQTYTLKTNSKGIAKLNTKKLKVGKHKVIIGSGNSNYKMSAKSLITIKR